MQRPLLADNELRQEGRCDAQLSTLAGRPADRFGIL